MLTGICVTWKRLFFAKTFNCPTPDVIHRSCRHERRTVYCLRLSERTEV
jgi:hypothetical protein